MYILVPLLDKIRTRFWSENQVSNGYLRIGNDGMLFALDSGQIFTASGRREGYYEMSVQVLPDVNGNSIITELEKPVQIFVNPVMQKYRLYNPEGGQYIEDVFPPSTKGFYGRMKRGSIYFLFIVQKMRGDIGYWLTIADSEKGQIHEAHIITQYEAEALALIDSQEFRDIWYEKIWSKIPDSEIKEIRKILDSSSVSWNDLSKLLGDISVPNLNIKETMRETLSQLIPPSFPAEIQEQIMLFLAYVLKRGIPKEDPMDYLYKFWPLPILGALLEGHLMTLGDKAEWPPYLKTLILASRKHLTVPIRTIEKSVSESPWLLFWEKTMAQFPNWFDVAAGILKKLNGKNEVISRVPIKKATRESGITWKKRLAILMYEIRLVGRINSQSIGLRDMVYLGAAYRWPHKHMKYITRLGTGTDNPPFLQVMSMPPAASTQVMRVLPSVMDVKWSTRMSNIELFNLKEKIWQIPIEKITSSIDDKCSLRKLIRKFNNDEYIENHKITYEEAKAMDLASEGIRVATLERKEYLDPWGFDYKEVRTLLSNLSERQVIQLSYEATNDKLISLATIIQGDPEKVISLCYSFLQNTPSTTAMLGVDNKQAIMLSKLPERPAYELVSELPRLGLNQDVVIRCLRPTTFQSYTCDFFQRLLREDGTWDDDVSAFLSQARSKRKQLSERNA